MFFIDYAERSEITQGEALYFKANVVTNFTIQLKTNKHLTACILLFSIGYNSCNNP